MAEKIGMWFAATFPLWPHKLIVFVVSMLPLVELRGGLILAPLFEIEIWKAVPICLLGNLIPIPFILLFITPIFDWMKKTKLFRPLVEKLENKARGKSEKIKKGEFWGLLLFVGIPLPGTGAWTGALIACMLGLNKKKAFLAIVCGVLLAAVIMCTITYLIPWIVTVCTN